LQPFRRCRRLYPRSMWSEVVGGNGVSSECQLQQREVHTGYWAALSLPCHRVSRALGDANTALEPREYELRLVLAPKITVRASLSSWRHSTTSTVSVSAAEAKMEITARRGPSSGRGHQDQHVGAIEIKGGWGIEMESTSAAKLTFSDDSNSTHPRSISTSP
jgi:hypothetical protein